MCSPSSNLSDLVLKFSAMTHWESKISAQPPRGKGLSPGTLVLRTSYQVSLSTERFFIRGVTFSTSFVCNADLGVLLAGFLRSFIFSQNGRQASTVSITGSLSEPRAEPDEKPPGD